MSSIVCNRLLNYIAIIWSSIRDETFTNSCEGEITLNFFLKLY